VLIDPKAIRDQGPDKEIAPMIKALAAFEAKTCRFRIVIPAAGAK
jgi:hypothetical protein